MRIAIFVALVAATALCTPATADVVVKDAWVRATPGAAKVSAGYATVVNAGKADDVLIGVETSLADMAHLHESLGADGMMRMESIKELPLPAGKEISLAPGGYHIMIMGLKQPLKVGAEMPLTFIFKNQGKVSVSARVQPLSATGEKTGRHAH